LAKRISTRHSDAHVAFAEAQLLPEPLDRFGYRGSVDDLALAHRVGRERDLAERGDDRGLARLELDHAHGVGPDVEADQAAGHGVPFAGFFFFVVDSVWTTRESRNFATS
jgi:hypothetical protein